MIEYALIAGLAAVALVGVGAPVGRSLTAAFQEIAAAIEPSNACAGMFCIEPAAGGNPGRKPPAP
ncbi:MAG TPA: Flp family type IVb pilin [Geminicoccaceae bacterium]|nr:Flp family type IVb pilin [Geminicoccus sp.]HMU52442.1 Flp family type IVb pilin [Geminicoccaceae bacterium]